MQVTKEFLDAFEKDFLEAMGPLQEKYGVSVSLGRITYEASCIIQTEPGRRRVEKEAPHQ